MQEEVRWLKVFLESMLQKDMNYKRRHKAYFSNDAVVAQVMKEVEVDIKQQKPKVITEDMMR
jgi:hypothetical protein